MNLILPIVCFSPGMHSGRLVSSSGLVQAKWVQRNMQLMAKSAKIASQARDHGRCRGTGQCSQATVSVVLNPNSKIKISSATRERILKIAEDLGYRAEGVPTVRLKPVREFVVIFDDLTVCPEAVISADGVREATWETGDIVAVYNCHGDDKMEGRTIDAVLQRPLAGDLCHAARTPASSCRTL